MEVGLIARRLNEINMLQAIGGFCVIQTPNAHAGFDAVQSSIFGIMELVLFTEGLVTPVTAGDIMEELLSDAAFLYGQ